MVVVKGACLSVCVCACVCVCVCVCVCTGQSASAGGLPKSWAGGSVC